MATASPMEHAVSLCSTLVEASTIRTLISFQVLHALPSDGSITLDDLASKTKVQAALLSRLLRVVVGTGFLTRDESGAYAHTPLSLGYIAMGDMYSAIYDELCVSLSLHEYFKEKGAREPDGDEANTHNPTTWKAGQEGKTVFEIVEQDPEKMKRFVQLMGQVEFLRPYTGFYDYGKLACNEEKGRVALVDVGGGNGKTLARILEAHPKLDAKQCMLQDREQVVEIARKSPDVPRGLQFQAHDFFSPQPLKGARAYQLRAVCHDWSDSAVTKILKNIAAAMAPDSKVLIADNVLPENGAKGMGSIMDMMMLAIGGKERTKANFAAVLDAAGLKLDGVYPAPAGTGFAVVEARLK